MNTAAPSQDILAIARQSVALIEDAPLRQALLEVYSRPSVKEAAATAENTFRLLTSRRWSSEVVSRFLNGFRATHVTALYVSGLMIRVQRQAARAAGDDQLNLFKAAAAVGEIIPEDTGVDDTPHSELYMTWANAIAGHDEWQLGRYTQSRCESFREFVKARRLDDGLDLEEGILTTAASENWNTGEYTHFSELVYDWMGDVLQIDQGRVGELAAYVTVHAGATELGHFLHAIDAWRLVSLARGRRPDPEKAQEVFASYLTQVGAAFGQLEGLFA